MDEIIGKAKLLNCRDQHCAPSQETVEMALDYIESLETQLSELKQANEKEIKGLTKEIRRLKKEVLRVQKLAAEYVVKNADSEARVKELEGFYNVLEVMISDARLVAHKAPDINMMNYIEPDVADLKEAMIEVYGILTQPMPTVLPTTESKEPKQADTHVLGDYNIWYEPCEKCGYDTARSNKLDNPTCWKCGGRISRDYSDRALKIPPIAPPKEQE